jgi:hypothetical protein
MQNKLNPLWQVNSCEHYYITGGQVPPQKLAALQRVLQSDFLNAVREVYESVYETVEISGNPEVRANATAKVRRKVN